MPQDVVRDKSSDFVNENQMYLRWFHKSVSAHEKQISNFWTWFPKCITLLRLTLFNML